MNWKLNSEGIRNESRKLHSHSKERALSILKGWTEFQGKVSLVAEGEDTDRTL